MEPTIPPSQPIQPEAIQTPRAITLASAVAWLDTAARLSGSLWWITDREGLTAGEGALSAYTGLPEEALSGAGWLAAIAPEDRMPLRKRWQAALTTTTPIATACRFLRADTQAAWLTVQSAPIATAPGEEPLWLWIATQTAQERAVHNIGHYRTLFEQTTQGIVLVGAQGMPLRVNEAAQRMLGLRLAQARGEAPPPPGWRIVREDGEPIEEPFREIAAATASGQATHIFWRALADDWPGDRWLSVTGSPVMRAHGQTRTRTLVFLTDVTERVRRREAMQSLAKQSSDELATLRAALDRVTDAFVALDYDGRFTYVNARARAQFAPDGEPLLERRFWEVFPSLAGTNLEQEYHRILRERTSSVMETQFSGDAWYEVRIYPAADGISVYIRDITSQKRAMTELDAALARERDARADAEDHAKQLDAVFEAVGDGMLVFSPDGMVTRANQAMRDLMERLGAPLTPPMFSSPLETVRENFVTNGAASSAEIELPMRRILAGETLSGDNTMDLQLRAANGRDLYLNISGAPIRSGDGSIQGAVENLRDVTAKRELELERSRAMNLVAHELRTPLTAIKLSIDLSLRRASRGLPIEAATMEVAASSCLQLERMVNDLVDAARAERKNMEMEIERCDMGDLAAQAIVEQEATTNRPIQFDPPPRALPVTADPMRVRQVLSNLLSNAVKYSPPDTAITVRVEPRDGTVWVGVSDEGAGVSAEAQRRLFEPFYRAPEVTNQPGAQGGLGLGLYLCKRIIDLHNGQIGMQNLPDHGSLFWFTLPLSASAATPEPDAAL